MPSPSRSSTNRRGQRDLHASLEFGALDAASVSVPSSPSSPLVVDDLDRACGGNDRIARLQACKDGDIGAKAALDPVVAAAAGEAIVVGAALQEIRRRIAVIVSIAAPPTRFRWR
jgi:hypothetical protein